MAMMAIGPDFDWGAYQRNGGSLTPQPGSQAWQENLNRQIQQQMAAIPAPQMPQLQPMPAFQAALQTTPTPQATPTLQQLQASLDFMQKNPGAIGVTPEIMENLQRRIASQGGAAASPVAGEDPRLTAILAQLQGQAALNDSVLSDRAAQGVAAQRAQMQRQLEKQLTGTLSSRGLLAGGGNVAKLRQELSAPMEEQLAAQQERIRQDLVGRRDATSNNLAAQLADLQRQKAAGESDRQRLLLEQQRAQQDAAARQQQFAMDQARFQWEAQQQAQQSAYAQAMQTALENQLRQQAMNQARQTGYNSAAGAGYNSGGGSMTGGVTGWNGGNNSFLDSGRQPEQVYADSVARGRQTNGQVPGNYFNESNTRAREEQQARAAQTQQQWRSANSGNGLSSAGSYTGISFDPVSAAGSHYSQPQGYSGYNAYQSAMQSGYNTTRNAFSQMDSLSGPVPHY